MTISVLIQVYNEEKHIKDCIESAKLLTDAVVVVDMQSTDKTREIAQKSGAKIVSYSTHPMYVEPAREFGIRQIQSKWVMILDADERITKGLAEEIKKAIVSEEYSYYKIPRKNIFAGKHWLRNGGWWPDQQMRLINIESFHSWPSNIHSTPVINGKLGYLHEPFLHFFHGDIEQMVDKTLIFEDIESNLLYEAGRPVRVLTFFRKFFGELWRRLFQKKGYRDGEIGIIEGIYQAFSKTITYLFLYEKKNRRSV